MMEAGTAMIAEAASVSVAERLYYDTAALEFTAKVTDIRLVVTERSETGGKSHVWQISLDRTAFYPESGGQPWDTGVLVATARSGATLRVPVERVLEDDAGEVWHQIRKPLEQGTAVSGHVDRDRRMDHAQQHTGQHLLSAVFLERIGARTLSFHLGAESVTIDLALPEGTAGLTAEQMADVEDHVNCLIFEDRPLTPRWHTRAEAEAMLARGELRKLPERVGPMRVVEMGGVEFNACGGTHVGSTGAIGGLLLRGTEKVKGGVRVEFACGLRAVRVARREHALLDRVAAALSVGAADVPERVARLQEETRAAMKERRALLEELAAARAEGLVAATPQGSVVRATFAGKPVEFAKRVASVCASAGRHAAVGAIERTQGAVALGLPSGTGLHAGVVLREAMAGFGARGGGSAELAQGVCEGEQVEALVASIGELLGRRFRGEPLP